MKYVAFIGTQGPTPDEALAEMRRDLPGWIEEMERRGVRLFGRELDFPQTGATVRVRDGRPLVTDGPFAETKEFVAGVSLFEFAGQDEAVELLAMNPVARFHPIEVRPFRNGLQLGEGMPAFAQGDYSAGAPFLLTTWVEGAPRNPAWDGSRQGARHVLSGALQGPEAAVTIRVVDGRTQRTDAPFLHTQAFIGGIDVVSCAGRQQAIELAATHPAAREHAIEVRPFHVG